MTDKDSTDAPRNEQEAIGEPAGDLEDTSSYSPTGNKPTHHWKNSTVAEPALEQRGTVFFAALQMTRMPMILTDPREDDNPIVFANQAFLDLTGYEESEVIGRNCRFLQGAGHRSGNGPRIARGGRSAGGDLDGGAELSS